MPPEDDDRYPDERDARTDDVERRQSHAIDQAQPDEGGGDVYAAVRRVDPAARGRVRGQEPDEKRKARRGGQQEPDRAMRSHR